MKIRNTFDTFFLQEIFRKSLDFNNNISQLVKKKKSHFTK